MFKNKLIAFAYHFSVSAIIMLIVALIIFYIWYPAPYFQLFNVTKIFILMLCVDLILGPLLTFIVYKKDKKTLKMDLIIIGCIQLAALSWGLYSIVNSRPAWIVIDKDIAYAISPALLSNPENKTQASEPSMFEQNWLRPKIVMLPIDHNTKNIIYRVDKYLPYNPIKANTMKLPLSTVEQVDNLLYKKIKLKYPKATGYIPIITEASIDLPLILIDKNGQPIATLVAENKITIIKKEI